MKKVHLFIYVVLACALTISGCGGIKETLGRVDSSGPVNTASVDLLNTKGEKIGTATLMQAAGGVKVAVKASGLTPGKHGIHFHEKGICDAPDFKSSGEHFNPKLKEHGLVNPQGPHAGDLPNLVVGKDGKVNTEMITSNVTLEMGKPNSLIKPGGVALVIHESEDDQLTNPAGNSGSRVACGVIKEPAVLK
ncbi:MAG TPA: superoxide dismutase family protein [Bacilli bacterium]